MKPLHVARRRTRAIPQKSVQPSDVVAKCFCTKQLQGSSCFDSLPAYIRILIREHYATPEPAADEPIREYSAVFARFPELPVRIQQKIIQFCMPSGQYRYLEGSEGAKEDAVSTLLRSLPAAAQANRSFHRYFTEQWDKVTIDKQDGIHSKSSSRRTFINFALDKLIISINHPLSNVGQATYMVQHSSQRQANLPLRLDEAWAHNKAETEILPLPAAFFTAMPQLDTYWLVVNDLAINTALSDNSTDSGCRCVFSPMIKCLADSVAKFHAFRYHVPTGEVTCAEMRRDQEVDELLTACGETNPNFAARITFIYGHDSNLLNTSDGLDWWHLPAWGLVNFKYEKLKKRLDWGLVTDVLRRQVSTQEYSASTLGT